MEHPEWQRRTLLFGLLGAAARKLTALQPRLYQIRSPQQGLNIKHDWSYTANCAGP